ncbi:general substrate transporter [Ramaria rubella]|nr:general substrate transporter [Ramaria rubella]
MGAGAVAFTGQAHYAHLIDDSRPWWKNRRLVTLNACILLLLITSSTNGYDGMAQKSLIYLNGIDGLQSLSQWRSAFNNPTGSKLGLLNAIQNIGSLAGYPFAPYLTDGLGRKHSILIGAFIMTAATIVQTASQNVGMFIGARFLIGFGLTFCANAAPLLVSEVSYPSQRAALTSMYNSLCAAWTTYGTFRIPSSWSWRIPSALQGLPSVLQLLLIWFVPESPRWLISKGREQRAVETIAYYHTNGDQNDPLVTYQVEEIKAAIQLEREVTSNVGYMTLFKTPGNRRRMRVIVALAFFSQWSGNGLISFYQTRVFDALGITGTGTQLLINGILQIWNLIIAIIASFLCERAGRRRLFLLSCAGMLLSWTAQTVCFAEFSLEGSASAAHGFIAFIFLFYAAYDIAFTPLIVSYTVEILPFSIRAKGFNVFNFTISVALIFNQYVNPIALASIGWKYYLVYLCWLVFELLFIFRYLIEVRSGYRTLEETAAIFDGDEKVTQLEEAAHIGDVQILQDIKGDSSNEAFTNSKSE